MCANIGVKVNEARNRSGQVIQVIQTKHPEFIRVVILKRLEIWPVKTTFGVTLTIKLYSVDFRSLFGVIVNGSLVGCDMLKIFLVRQ